MTTKKAKFIDILPALTEAEKNDVKDFFGKYPVYENKIDWNNKSLQYNDFKPVFELGENSTKNKRRMSKINPITLFTGHNCKVIAQTVNFIIAVPLDWECAVYFNSFNCGAEGARWCIGDKKTNINWITYDNDVFFFVYFINKDAILGRKIIIQYNFCFKYFFLWLAENKIFWEGYDIFEFDAVKTDIQTSKIMAMVFKIVNEIISKIENKDEMDYQKPLTEYTVVELFNIIDEYHICFRSGINITVGKLKQLREISGLIYDKGNNDDRKRIMMDIKTLEDEYKNRDKVYDRKDLLLKMPHLR
jgi:hypothetical protein